MTERKKKKKKKRGREGVSLELTFCRSKDWKRSEQNEEGKGADRQRER